MHTWVRGSRTGARALVERALGLGLGQLPLERLDLAGLPNLELRGRLCLRWGNSRERGREADMVGERERA